MISGTKRGPGSRPVRIAASLLMALSIAARSASAEWRVVRVVDGDTLVAARGARVETVRIDRIDTPEHGPRALCDLERRRAELAAAALARLAPPGGVVDLPGERRDRHRRLLSDVIAGGVSVGPELVRQGHAQWWNGKWPKPDWCGPSVR